MTSFPHSLTRPLTHSTPFYLLFTLHSTFLSLSLSLSFFLSNYPSFFLTILLSCLLIYVDISRINWLFEAHILPFGNCQVQDLPHLPASFLIFLIYLPIYIYIYIYISISICPRIHICIRRGGRCSSYRVERSSATQAKRDTEREKKGEREGEGGVGREGRRRGESTYIRRIRYINSPLTLRPSFRGKLCCLECNSSISKDTRYSIS